MSIPLQPVGRAARAAQAHVHEYDAPYRAFIAASLVLGIGGGFLLAVLLPLSQALEWDWGTRYQGLVQAHGQLQLLGFGGLFVMGMSLRLSPRFSGRPLAYTRLIPAIIPLVGGSLVLRALAEPAGDSAGRGVALVASGVLMLLGSAAFAAVLWGTLAHRASKAESTGYFLALGAFAHLAAAVLNLLLMIEVARDGLVTAPFAKQGAVLLLEQYGFIMMFLCGIATRAVPTLTGHARADRASYVAAAMLPAGVSLYAVAALWAAYRSPSTATARIEDAGLLVIAATFVLVTSLTGVFHPRANRVGASSQMQFNFVRSAFAWLLAGSALIGWYGVRGFAHGEVFDTYELDAIRHALTIGVLTMMLLGMGMLIVPEFAGRRLQHKDERLLIVVMVVAMNVAAVLRIWPAIEGIGWIASTRYWPMEAAGVLASSVVIIFGMMFGQSYLEQRTPGWGSTGALASRGGGRRETAE